MRVRRTLSCALMAGSMALMTPLMAATPASAADCFKERTNTIYGRTVILWRCGGWHHGQILNASPGDSVEMRYVSPMRIWITFGKSYVKPGSRSANSGSVLTNWTPPTACIHIANRPGAFACA